MFDDEPLRRVREKRRYPRPGWPLQLKTTQPKEKTDAAAENA